MPGMNGFEFAKRISEFNPLAKILLMSAFEDNDFDSDILAELKIDGFLQKPVFIDQLKEKISEHICKKNSVFSTCVS